MLGDYFFISYVAEDHLNSSLHEEESSSDPIDCEHGDQSTERYDYAGHDIRVERCGVPHAEALEDHQCVENK